MGGTETDKADATSELGRDMDAHYPGGGRCSGGGDLRHLPSEHPQNNYLNKAHYEPVTGDSMAPRILSLEAVVGKGGTQSREDTRGGLGVIGGEGLGERAREEVEGETEN